jgi:hypothetical protein
MPSPNKITTDTDFNGIVRFTNDVSMPTGSLGNREIDSTDPISEAKLEHIVNYVYRTDAAPANGTYGIGHITKAYSDITRVCVSTFGAIPSSGGSYEVDVKVNGTTILTAVVDMDDTSVLNTIYDGTLAAGASNLSGDKSLTVVITNVTGTPGTGLHVTVETKQSDTDVT